MNSKEMKELLEQAKKELSGFILVEDKEFMKALLSGNIVKDEHKENVQRIKDLMNNIINVQTLKRKKKGTNR